jgi:hypothetical protein
MLYFLFLIGEIPTFFALTKPKGEAAPSITDTLVDSLPPPSFKAGKLISDRLAPS